MTLKNRKEMKLTLTLPDELIEETLLRLPVRSLLRFKCVCKSWLTLISNPQFAKSHYDIAAAPTHRLLVKPYRKCSSEFIGIEAPLHDDSAVVHLNLTPPQSSLITSVSSNYLRILGSCRGIILLKYREDDDLILWNPSTGARKTISCSPGGKLLYGFGYDPSTDDYVVVIAMESSTKFKTHLEFFSLKTNSWNKVEGFNFPYSDISVRFISGLPLNEALHWLVFSKGDFFTKDAVIITFDLIKRSLSEIPLPRDCTASMYRSIFEIFHFMVIEGCLGLYCSDDVCWVMKEYKVQLSWTKFIVSSNRYIPCDSHFPICFSIGAGIVGSDDIRKLLKLDDNGELLEISRIMRWFVKEGPVQSAIYRESLQSFPSDFGEARKDDQH
ncbi:F-box/kelch-repeat protein At3g23880-like [Gastrolobium bilobum]|uniref:F-box/kelch-repeat protein At3g23880-like n=1 Tax=Gastrolobium bilobum TaxID=150636 RepID=UPI002AAFB247|nr:F-box/kelch-repeat protein At3g23880-like [Gastrolobium bilobum]